jgi:LCP family protein required for cell wall assembly
MAELFDISSNPNSVFAFGSGGGTPTRTPFAPILPTGTPRENTIAEAGVVVSGAVPTITPTPTLGVPWGDFPGPTRGSAIEIPPPVPEINFPESVINILLLGSDDAPHRYGHRTDTIMILSLDPDSAKAMLLSVPRDLFVYIPGRSMDRINAAFNFGGIEMIDQTILYNFGIDIDHWVQANFIGFEAAVDHLGGIDVQVGGHLYDECGGVYYDYYPGTYHMDGHVALCYARMRKTSNDFDRIRRQQEVLKAMFQKVLTLDGLTKLPQLYGEFNKWVDSDVGLGDLLPLIPLASALASGDAGFNGSSIDSSLVIHWTMPISGAQVLLPDREKIQEHLKGIYEY